MASNNPPIRWAIIGTSSTAKKRILKAMAQLDGHIPELIVGRSASKLADFQKEFSIHNQILVSGHNDYIAAIDSNQIDAVYISLPNSMHAEIVCGAIGAGKHVLCEKPMFLTTNDFNNAKTIARHQVIAENFSYSLTDSFMRVRSILENGEIGELVSINTMFSFNAEKRYRIRFSQELCGGSFLDLGCYSIDLISQLRTAEITNVTTMCNGPRGEGVKWLDSLNSPIDATCICKLELTDAFSATVSTSIETYPQQWITIQGTKGTIIAPNLFRQEGSIPMVILCKDNEIQTFNFNIKPQEVLLLEWFANRMSDDNIGTSEDQWMRWKANVSIIEAVAKEIKGSLPNFLS